MQNHAHPGFVDVGERYDCAQCIAWHQDEYQFPALSALNAQAWELYGTIQDQQRAGGMDVIGLDYTVVPIVFSIYEVPPGRAQRMLFERLILINRAVSEHRSQQRELEAQRTKNQRGAR